MGEFHRMTPYKVPTVIAAAGSGMTCAGRNSLNRYLRATGFSGVEVETSKETAVMFSAFETEPIMSKSIMKLPVVYTKEEGEPLLPKDELEQELAKGIVCVVFIKLNGEERSLRGTTNEGFIPKQLHGKSNSATDESIVGANFAQLARSEKERGGKKIGEDQVVMFDVDIQSWRSCKYSNIIQLRVRLHPYETWPGSVANLEEYFDQCKLLSA